MYDMYLIQYAFLGAASAKGMLPHLWNRFEDQEEAGANQFFSGRHPNPPEAFGMFLVLHGRLPAI